MMNLPAFYEFTVDDKFINFFNEKFEYYKQQSFLVQKNSTCTCNGVQTKNVLDLNENDVNENLNVLRKELEYKCGCEFEYHWVHLIEYENGGYQAEHKHDHNEDFSIIVYLNSSNDGDTYFFLNQRRNIVKRVFPQKGKSVMFLSNIVHGANKTNNNKKVLVLGLKIKEI